MRRDPERRLDERSLGLVRRDPGRRLDERFLGVGEDIYFGCLTEIHMLGY